MSIRDCELQTFTSGGPGGQHQNRSRTGVRVIHHASNARGESREERSQLQNKKAAFLRMIATKEFELWLRIETGRVAAMESNLQIPDADLKIEVKSGGRWVQVSGDQLN